MKKIWKPICQAQNSIQTDVIFLRYFCQNFSKTNGQICFFLAIFDDESEYVNLFTWKRFLQKSDKNGHFLGILGQIWARIRNLPGKDVTRVYDVSFLSYCKNKLHRFVKVPSADTEQDLKPQMYIVCVEIVKEISIPIFQKSWNFRILKKYIESKLRSCKNINSQDF